MLRKRAKQGPGEINAGSMADIAFLLLIFFLVTTTMDTDAGILRLLPPIVEDQQEADKVKDRNVYVVLINDADMLLVEGELMDIKDLRAGAKEFMVNPANLENLPEKSRVTAAECQQRIAEYKAGIAAATDEKDKQTYRDLLEKYEGKLSAVRLLGEYNELPGSAVISLQTGSKTSYDMYVKVQNELEAGIRELRDELCKEKFGRKFTELDEKKDEDKELIKAIRMVYPQRISEAEPVDVTKKPA
ncbi:MAG: biopolymer transporter ExbD [Flavobacteriales bacterium]|jgi:biopolymer transport protein ExbD|nr:MAG: biopolymer transporter ExbD [Flavobacteriales bacterium]